jgi:hypothetical protein
MALSLLRSEIAFVLDGTNGAAVRLEQVLDRCVQRPHVFCAAEPCGWWQVLW